MSRGEAVLEAPALPTFLRYVGASTLGLLALTSAAVVDGLMVGKWLGADALAAVNLLIPLWILLFGSVLMLAIGASVVAGHYLGAGRRDAASRVFSACVCLALVFGVAVVDRLGADGLLPEAELIERVRDKLEALRLTLSGNGRVLIERWLTQTQLPAKANLLTRVEDIDELEADMELAAYTTIDNPLCAPARIERALEEVAHV